MAQNAVHLVKIGGGQAVKQKKITKEDILAGELPETFNEAILNGPTTTSARQSNPVNTTVFTFTPVSITNTGYQLQTNGATRNAIVQNSDGSLSVANTFSAVSVTPWADRGTGYNYYNGSVWGPGPTVRVETTRAGFTNIAVTSSGKEHTLAHSPTPSTNPMAYNSRPVKGTGAWTQNSNPILSPTGPGGSLFPRMTSGGTNGNSLHAIAILTPTVFPNGAAYQGQNGAFAYARSTDEGVTWSSWTCPSQLDTSNGFPGFPNGGDAYAIDARGDVIAYAVGTMVSDFVLMKSTDNGTTWTQTLIKNFFYRNYTGQYLTDTLNIPTVIDTIDVGDGNIDVVLDNSNNAHVFFGHTRVLCDDTAQGWSYYPVTDGLYYWNETMTPGHPVIIAGMEDLDLSGTLDFPTPTPSTDVPMGIYLGGMVSHPSCGVDASGKIFCLYDAPIEAADDGTGHLFRNVYVMASSNGGTTWTTPARINPTISMEQVYPNIPSHFTGGCIPVTYQEDLSIGNGLTNQSSGNPDPFNGFADINYGCLSISEVLSTHEIINHLFNVSDNYPNPFHGNSSITITMNKSSKVTLDIYNPLGAKVAATITSDLSTGEHTMNIDGSKLSAGIYFYTVKAGEYTVTKKMIIE